MLQQVKKKKKRKERGEHNKERAQKTLHSCMFRNRKGENNK